ncbi:APC family permease [Carboxydothermus hydrogenoformans]|uniref:Putative membrane protein n=1 Tax=Carboxydothermus hydrogenoformans (strain ATCC BAA-161 / DSM 6008 / Z-2901) TaxID=246194 RepID=Q3AEG0_CARHZ|nr:APC family permease [Carboxydothermus hydrogenoformans]ABB14748.1 putative membrane protein [Carboxydothermus hydrogenoformans Z-2901]
MNYRIKDLLIGSPLRTEKIAEERLTKIKALAIFSSDALSSVAYATEEILLVLIAAGPVALKLSLPISIAILFLLGILTLSYRQGILAYPNGGGAYVVSLENLGQVPGLIAGSSLLVDYILTVAVSVSSGIAAITSAFPSLYPYRVILGVLTVLFITIMNLRGIRESGTFFAIPTYAFIFTFLILIGVGTYKLITGQLTPLPVTTTAESFAPLTLFLLLKAFSSGCTALTGVETISNGVPAFFPPEDKNARITMVWMALLLGTLFFGITYLAYNLNVVPKVGETVVSQIARIIFGKTLFYYLVQASTAIILFLAANSSFNGFPRLSCLMARDGYLPRILSVLGTRLVFSHGIVILGVISSLLIIIFKGDTHALIPLYAVGVFVSFTLMQAGLIKHWYKTKESGWKVNILINSLGAIATGIASIIIATTKFLGGAWIVVILIPLMILLFSKIKRHYLAIAEQLRVVSIPEDIWKTENQSPLVIIPVASFNKVVLNAIKYARSISEDVIAINIAFNEESKAKIEEKWEKFKVPAKLLVITSAYRDVYGPLLRFINHMEHRAVEKGRFIMVVIPEFVPHKWWHFLLHNQTGFKLKTLLLFRKNVLVTSVPYHLTD